MFRFFLNHLTTYKNKYGLNFTALDSKSVVSIKRRRVAKRKCQRRTETGNEWNYPVRRDIISVIDMQSLIESGGM